MISLDESRKQWFALFTASNNEKQVERHLCRKEIETFLPLYTVTRRWRNRTTAKVQLPLFAGYIFARFARNESARVLEVPMLYSIVGNRRGSLPVPDAEIEALRAALATGQTEPHPYLKVGQRARIRTGALTSWEGIVSRLDSGLRVVLTVESIMRSFAVHVNADDIEVLDAPALAFEMPANPNQNLEKA
ncbi:MAG: transcription termination/antitermination NusG family protein [Terracidiphilus sp.]